MHCLSAYGKLQSRESPYSGIFYSVLVATLASSLTINNLTLTYCQPDEYHELHGFGCNSNELSLSWLKTMNSSVSSISWIIIFYCVRWKGISFCVSKLIFRNNIEVEKEKMVKWFLMVAIKPSNLTCKVRKLLPLYIYYITSYYVMSYHIFFSYNFHILQKHTNTLYKYKLLIIRFILVFGTRNDSQKPIKALSSSPILSTVVANSRLQYFKSM